MTEKKIYELIKKSIEKYLMWTWTHNKTIGILYLAKHIFKSIKLLKYNASIHRAILRLGVRSGNCKNGH
jgi:hypothetical protein